MEVILIVDALNLQNKEVFEKHLKKEGIIPIEGEDFAYSGKTTTSLVHTQTFILHVCKEALSKSGYESAKIMFQIGENPMEAYVYDHGNKDFKKIMKNQ